MFVLPSFAGGEAGRVSLLLATKLPFGAAVIVTQSPEALANQ
jgi:hypothetical protein